MKLSMRIIERHLRRFKPVPVVMSNDMCLEGVRLFSQSTPPDGSFVYVGHDRDFFPETSGDEVFVMNRNDVIQTTAVDLEDVFNAVQEAFDHYHDFEYKLMLAVQSAEPVQRVIEALADEFGSAFIIDKQFHIVAISTNMREMNENEAWNTFTSYHIPSPDFIFQYAAHPVMKRINMKNFAVEYEYHDASIKLHGLFSSFHNRDGNVIGQCVIAMLRSPETADKQVFSAAMEIMNSLDTATDRKEGDILPEVDFSMVLSGRNLDSYDISVLNRMMAWSEEEYFSVICLELKPKGNVSERIGQGILSSIRTSIRNELSSCIVLMKDARLICCFPLGGDYAEAIRRYTELPDCIEKLIAKKPQVVAGASLPFRPFGVAANYLEQAELAMRHARDLSNSAVCGFHACALKSIMLSSNLDFRERCVHPAVKILKDWDTLHHTSYAETLRCFLHWESSYLNASKELHVHMNTVVYRIEKVRKICPMLNIDDPDEKAYLRCSFLIDEVLNER